MTEKMEKKLIPTSWKLIRVNGDVSDFHGELFREPGYDVLNVIIKPLLDRADMEHVSVLANFDLSSTDYRPLDMFVDDIGLKKGLPRNEAATTIYWRNWMTYHPGANPEALHFISGPAVLFSRRVWY